MPPKAKAVSKRTYASPSNPTARLETTPCTSLSPTTHLSYSASTNRRASAEDSPETQVIERKLATCLKIRLSPENQKS
jgi:hypothetical protein